MLDIHQSRQMPEATPPAMPSSGAQPQSEGQADPESRTALAKVHLGSAASDREILVRGRRAFERGDDNAALESFARLASHGLEYADVYYMAGILHERRDELDAALDNLRSAVRINPSYVEALLALASLYERRGDFDQSQGYAERASQLAKPTAGSLDPTTRGKLANQQAALGDALAQAGERRDAIEEYRRALDRCPTFHDVRHRLGMTLREAGLPFQAAQEFRRILRSHSGMLDSQIQLGLTYYSMGRTPEAIGEWEAVLEKDSGRNEARMYLRLVRGAGQVAPRPVTDTSGNADLADDDSNDDIEISGWSKSVLTTGPGETHT
jgi:tetratricopeptide (TPR) repeat protein